MPSLKEIFRRQVEKARKWKEALELYLLFDIVRKKGNNDEVFYRITANGEKGKNGKEYSDEQLEKLLETIAKDVGDDNATVYFYDKKTGKIDQELTQRAAKILEAMQAQQPNNQTTIARMRISTTPMQRREPWKKPSLWNTFTPDYA